VFPQLIFYSQFEDGATYGTIALDDIEILYSECPDDAESVTVPVSSSASPPADTTPLDSPSTTEDDTAFTDSSELNTTPDELDETVEENSLDGKTDH
jgi:hypothetical protein